MSEHNDNERVIGLPENAYRELKPGEEYNPVMSPLKIVPEVTLYSVLWGLLMAIIFSAAAAYLGLKIGQVFEAAIPIAIIAIGISALTKRKNALGENIIIQSIGSTGCNCCRCHFHTARPYILNLEAHFLSGVFSSLGCVGHSVSNPVPKVFCSGYARPVSLS